MYNSLFTQVCNFIRVITLRLFASTVSTRRVVSLSVICTSSCIFRGWTNEMGTVSVLLYIHPVLCVSALTYKGSEDSLKDRFSRYS